MKVCNSLSLGFYCKPPLLQGKDLDVDMLKKLSSDYATAKEIDVKGILVLFSLYVN